MKQVARFPEQKEAESFLRSLPTILGKAGKEHCISAPQLDFHLSHSRHKTQLEMDLSRSFGEQG